MPDRPEARHPGQSTTQAQVIESPRDIQEELVAQIREAQDALAKKQLGDRLKNEVKDDRATAHELKNKGEEISGVQAQQAAKINRDLIRVLKGVEEGIVTVPETNKSVLLKLNDKIGTQLNNITASFLQPLVSKLLDSTQTVENLQAEFESLRAARLGLFSPHILEGISQSIIESADEGKLAVSGDQAREMFKTEPVRDEQTDNQRFGPEEELGVYKMDWDQSYRHFFGPEDEPVLKALYSTESLGNLVTMIRDEVVERPSSSGLPKDTIDKLISSELEERIVLTYSKMFTRVDESRPDKTFEEIEQEGSIFSSIRAVEVQFKGALQLMAKKMRQMEELPESLKDFKFFQRYSIEGIKEKELPIGNLVSGEKKLQIQYKITPVPGVEPVSLADFLTGISSEIVHENNIRRYLHNVQSLFLRPAGKDGFWSQVAGYSEQIKSEDIDSMMLLPDSDKSISAYRLYVKYLEEEFAKVDWIHQPNMFDGDMFKNKSKTIQRVFEDLKRMYPDLSSDSDVWRLQRALAMGVGLARGIYLSEAEIAAYADPHINVENGSPKFTSYFTNDNAATEPLNPLHFFLRWQAESLTMGPLIYMPVDALEKNKKLLRKWDHTELWNRMKQYRDSFQNGNVAFSGDPNDKTLGNLFVDILPNYAKGGSYLTRGGWRMENGIDGWLYDSQGRERGFVEKFKALENIGYEAVKVLNLFDKHHPLTLVEKNTLYSYLANKYLGGDVNGDVWAYIGALPAEDLSKQEKLFMSTVYSRMLFQRMPTKFVRLERDRVSKTGESLWKKVRKDMASGTDKVIPVEQIDNAMKDLSFVEVSVRNRVSQEMRAHLSSQDDDKKDLSDFTPSTPYIVDENAIKRYITDPQKQEIAINLYRSINNVMLKEKTLDKVAGVLSGSRGYPFALGSEELDSSFVALRNAGSRVLARALGDTAQIETKVTQNLKAFMGSLHHVSIDPKHDFSPLVKHIKEMKETLESIHGHAVAGKVAQSMSTLAVAYFKKDDVARSWITKLGTIGRPNSLAAEFAGTFTGVWEWDVAEVANFMTVLERERIVAKAGAYDLSYQGHDVPTVKKKNFLGVKWSKIEHNDEGFVAGKSLRKQLGATGADITKEIITKYLPLAMLGIMYTLMSKAFKETNDKK